MKGLYITFTPQYVRPASISYNLLIDKGQFNLTGKNVGLTYQSYEPETVAYLTAISVPNNTTVYYASTAQEITGAGIWSAVDTFVVSVKNAVGLTLGTNNLSTKFKAIYPFIGGTATAHKYNLCNPADTDAAYRLTFAGGLTHGATGVKGNGANGVADTHLKPNDMSQNDVHCSVNVRTAPTISGAAEIGDSGSGAFYICVRYALSGYNTISNLNNTSIRAITNTNYTGFFLSNRASSSVRDFYRNGSSIDSWSVSSTTPSSSGLNLFKGAAVEWSDAELTIATFGVGFTSTQISSINSAVQTLQSSLFR